MPEHVIDAGDQASRLGIRGASLNRRFFGVTDDRRYQGHDQASKQQLAHGDLRHSAIGRMQNLVVIGLTGLSLRLAERQSFTDHATKCSNHD
ncbi:hypothetical protein D3C84_1031340 [compost metagenome]